MLWARSKSFLNLVSLVLRLVGFGSAILDGGALRNSFAHEFAAFSVIGVVSGGVSANADALMNNVKKIMEMGRNITGPFNHESCLITTRRQM